MLCARKDYVGVLKKVIFTKMSGTGVLFRDVDVTTRIDHKKQLQKFFLNHSTDLDYLI